MLALSYIDSPPDEALSVKEPNEPAGSMLAEDEELAGKEPTNMQQEEPLDNMEFAGPVGSDDADGLSDEPEEPDVSKAMGEGELNDDSAQQLDDIPEEPSAQGMMYNNVEDGTNYPCQFCFHSITICQ